MKIERRGRRARERRERKEKAQGQEKCSCGMCGREANAHELAGKGGGDWMLKYGLDLIYYAGTL